MDDVAGLVERLQKHPCECVVLDTASDALQAQAAEIERLQDRLEMRKAFQLGEDGETLVEIAVELGSIPDGIAARDATIELHDDYIDELEAKLREAVEVVRELADRWEILCDVIKPLINDDAYVAARAFLASTEKQEDSTSE